MSFPPWHGLHAANNLCRRSYFDTFQFYFTSSWGTVGVWYLVSLEIATPEQIEQSGFNAITRTVLWPSATKLTGQEEHRQIQQFRTPFPTLLHLLYYQCHPIYFVYTIATVHALSWQLSPACGIFWQRCRKPKIDSVGNSCRRCLCSNTNGVAI